MPRSEYYEPALLPGEKEQPQIIIDAVELYDLLVRAEMMMTKVDASVTGTARSRRYRTSSRSSCSPTTSRRAGGSI